MFKFFDKLIGCPTKCFVTTTRLLDIGEDIDRVATEQQCELIIVPWQINNDDTPGLVAYSILFTPILDTTKNFISDYYKINY